MRSCLALALGYNPPPRWGSMRKKRPPAASQIVQSPGEASSLQRGQPFRLTGEAGGRILSLLARGTIEVWYRPTKTPCRKKRGVPPGKGGQM